MKNKSEILIEGSYSYLKIEDEFAVENFKLIKKHSNASFQFVSEIHSTTTENERLQTNITYDLSKDFLPEFVMIEKSISNKYVLENFQVTATGQALVYKLKTNQGEQEFHKNLPPLYHLSSPAFCTSMIWTHRFNPLAEDQKLEFIYSNNQWSYSNPPQNKTILVKLINQISEDYQINNIPVNASEWELMDDRSANPGPEQENHTKIFMSKDFSIPYELKSNDLRIVLTNLIKHS